MGSVIIMRHSEAASGWNDHDRVLTDFGQELARSKASAIANALGARVNCAFHSGAARTKLTCEALASGGLLMEEIIEIPELYNGTSSMALTHIEEEINSRYADSPAEPVILIVGHIPTIMQIAGDILSPSSYSDTSSVFDFSPAHAILARYERSASGEFLREGSARYFAHF